MKITTIKIRKLFTDGTLRAILSVTFDGQLVIHDIKVIQSHGKSFLVMPFHRDKAGVLHDLAHPINADFRNYMERVVLFSVNREIQRMDWDIPFTPLNTPDEPLSEDEYVPTDCSQAVTDHFSGESGESAGAESEG